MDPVLLAQVVAILHSPGFRALVYTSGALLTAAPWLYNGAYIPFYGNIISNSSEHGIIHVLKYKMKGFMQDMQFEGSTSTGLFESPSLSEVKKQC